jgi:predicted transcriptional regulator
MSDVMIQLAADIVSAYVSKNSVPLAEIPGVIASVHASLTGLSTGSAATPAEPMKGPAAPIKKSVTPEFIICLEDGKQFKSLKRHLRTAYGLSPEQYREKWKLPADYPMVAPAYAARRSAMAKSIGLGQQGRKAPGKQN